MEDIKINKDFSETLLKSFCKDWKLPIQIYTTEFMEYYINLYDTILNTKSKFYDFQQTLNKFNNFNEFQQYEHNLIFSLADRIKSTEAYKYFNECDLDSVYPITKDVQGVIFSKSGDIYKPENHGNYYISIDLKKANFQALKYHDGNLIFNSKDYEDLLRLQQCEYTYFWQSKQVRQVMFGQLNMGRIARIERFITQTILTYILEHLSDYIKKEDIIIFTADEIIIRCTENTFWNDDKLYDLKSIISEDCDVDIHVENFKLNYIENKFYVKEHKTDVPIFKGGSSIYFPQAFKHYMNQELCDKDLCFSYEGNIAKFIEPLKW